MPAGHGVSLSEATRVWVRVALLSFGGPAGQIAVMHRIVVEEKRWIGEARFLHALAYCSLLPGPEATQLATYIGWLMHRTLGGLIAGWLFVLPGIIALMALSWAYVLLGDVAAVQGLFFGLKAAVLAIVAQALVRLGRRALANPARIVLAAAAFAALFVFAIPFPAVVAAAALAGWAATMAGGSWFTPAPAAETAEADHGRLGAATPPHAVPSTRRTLRTAALWLVVWFVPVLLVSRFSGPGAAYPAIAWFFSKMAVVTFGGAYAVLAYVAQAAVETYHWLKPGEMLDGLGMAETTPGPLIMVLQFVGFLGAWRAPGSLPPLLGATLGGLLATWVTFVPCFLWIFAGAPWIEALRGNRALAGALAGITAAIVGVIANLTAWFALHALFSRLTQGPAHLVVPDPASLNPAMAALTGLALVLCFGTRLGLAGTLAICAALGAGLRLGGWT